MTMFLYWIGLIHVVAYSLLGLSALMICVLNITFKRLGITRDLLMMYQRYLRKKHGKKEFGA